MPTRFVQSSTIAAESYTGSHCGVGYNPTDDQLYVNPDGTKRPVMTGRGQAEILTAASTLTAADFGKTFFLNSGTEFATVLPAPVLGARLKFVVGAGPSGASYTITSASSTNNIVGGFSTADIDGAADVDTETSGGDTITFVDGVAVKGDWVALESDGTSWYASGNCKTYNGITITTAS